MASHLIEVEFKGNRREFFLWESEDIPAVNAPVIVEADRGEDLGHVHATGDFARKRNEGVPHGTGGSLPSRKARRVATRDDVKRHDDLRAQDEDARRKAMERVRAHALTMKVSDAEWQWDRKKLTFYFTAEKRVDFRTLVRELASTFRTRIELKQIGVRDEAKRLDGIGRCGRQYCSAAWLPELRPVSLGVAKDQRLSLNPTQISGACGRLMCSLRYEHEFYVQARKRFPKEGKTVKTSAGDERVIANDIFRERVTLRNGEGEMRTIPLQQLLQESDALGQSIVPAAYRTAPDPVEVDEELLVAEESGELVDIIYEEPAAEPRPRAPQSRDAERSSPAQSRGDSRQSRADSRTKPSHGEARPDRSRGESRPQQSRTAPPGGSSGRSEPGQASSQGPQRGESERSGEGANRRRRGRRGGRRNKGRRDNGGGGGAPPPAGGN